MKYTTLERGWDRMDWIHLTQNMDHCRALANSVMSLAACKEELSFIELAVGD
jgi:hypothetical protein